MDGDCDRKLKEEIRANRRNNRALFALIAFVIALATPSIVSEWQISFFDGKMTSAEVRSRSIELGVLEKSLIILCVASGIGVLSQKQLGQLISLILKVGKRSD